MYVYIHICIYGGFSTTTSAEHRRCSAPHCRTLNYSATYCNALESILTVENVN